MVLTLPRILHWGQGWDFGAVVFTPILHRPLGEDLAYMIRELHLQGEEFKR